MNIREKAQELARLASKRATSGLTADEYVRLGGLNTEAADTGNIARKLIEALDVLERIEWAGSDEFESPRCECPICGASKQKRQHKPGCEIGALLHSAKESDQP